MRPQASSIFDLPHGTRFLHRAIPGELALRLCPRLLRTVPPKERISRFDVAGDLRRHAKPDVAAAHLRKRDRAITAILLVREAALPFTNLSDRPTQIAVPFERVHRQI